MSHKVLGMAPCLLALVAPGVVKASEPRPGESSTVAGSVEEIVVTARKQSETDVEVPVALTTFTSRDLAQYNTTSLSDVARMTPQLVIGTTPTATGATINLRGIGGDPIAATIAQPVSIVIDGVQVNQGNAALLGLHDLARVEVLKGPQALYYGKNSPAGIVSLVSADPTKGFEALVRSGYEFENRQAYGEAVLSGPLSDAVGARLDVYGSDQTGWFKNRPGPVEGLVGPSKRRAPGQQELFGRLTLTYETPDGRFDSKLKLSARDVNRDYGFSTNFQYFACPAGRPALSVMIAGVSTDCKIDRYYVQGDIDPATAATDPIFRDGAPYGRTRQYLAALTMNYQLADELSLTSATGYYRSRDVSTGSYAAMELTHVVGAGDLRIRQFSQEFRLASAYGGPLNFMVGGYYERGSLGYYVPVSLGPLVSPVPVLADANDWDQSSRAMSAFGQITYDIAHNLDLSVGGRYSHERKEFSGIGLSGPLTFATNKRRFNNFSPEATLTFRPSEDVNIYGTYRTGFKSGGFHLDAFKTPGADISFDQEKVRGGEVGAKGFLNDHQLKFQAATYYYKYSGLQLGNFDPIKLTTDIRNVGSAKVYGLESAIVYSPAAVRGLSLNANLGYNVAKYISYVAPCYAGQTIAVGCNLQPVGGAFNGQDLAGRPLVHSPKWALTVGSDYTQQLGGGLKLNAAAEANYSSSFFTNQQLDPRSRQGEFWKLNARLAISAEDDAWELAIIGKNLTNELTIGNANGAVFTGRGTGTAGPAVLQDLVATIDTPRTIGIQLTLRNNVLSRAR